MQRASAFTGWHVKVEQINSEVSATKKRYLNDFLHSICSLLCNSTILFENKQLARILQQTADENRCRLAKLFSFYRKYFYDFLSILNFDFLFDSVGELRKKNLSCDTKTKSTTFCSLLRHIQLKQSPIDETTRNQMTNEKNGKRLRVSHQRWS